MGSVRLASCATLLGSFVALGGCDEADGRGGSFADDEFIEACDPSDEGCKADDASSIAYTCATASVDANGTWWSYEVPGFNNLSQTIGISIHKGAAPGDKDNLEFIGTEYLDRTHTETWSNGNLTVRLGLKSAAAGSQYGAKSVAVTHANAGVEAGLDNGYCESKQLPTFDEAPPGHGAGASLAQELDGKWRANDPTTASDVEFRLTEGHDGKAIGPMLGRMRCVPDAGGAEPVSGNSFPSSVAYNLFSIVMVGKQLWDTFVCATDPDGFVESSITIWVTDTRSRLVKTPPKSFCADGLGNRYADVWSVNGHTHAGWLCINNHDPSNMAMYAYVPGKGTSQWVQFWK